MLRIVLLVLLGSVVLLGAIAFFNRTEIFLHLARRAAAAEDVAPNRPVEWAQGPETSDRPLSERPPNIVFILADDLGINDISTFGGGVAGGTVPTPNIDALAASGAVFTQAYAGTASCAPSRGMIMTGRYPTRTGFEFTPTPPGMSRVVSMIANEERGAHPPTIYRADAVEAAPDYDGQGLPGSEVTVAEMLKQRDYHNVHIGKWHLGRTGEFAATKQGFDESLLMASGLYLPEDDPDVVNAKLDFDPIDKFLWARMRYAAAFNEGDWFEPGGYITDWWTDEAEKVIRANRNRPFFLYLAHWGAHTPLQALKSDYDALGHIEEHRVRVYAAMIRALDRSVGDIMATLEEEGLAENTIIVFSSDNGAAGYIGIPEVNAPYRGWKLTFFEGGLRAPLFISWPGRIAPGTRVDAPVAHIDLAPTLAAAAEAPLPEGVAIDGVDLLPYATGERDGRPHETLFWRSGYYRVVRHGDWKLQVTERPEGAVWLYDLAADPTERENLAEARPEKVAELRALLDVHEADAVEPLYPYALEGAIAVDKTLAEPFEEGDAYVYWPN